MENFNSHVLVWQDKGKIKEITTLIEDFFVQRGDSSGESAFLGLTLPETAVCVDLVKRLNSVGK